MYALAYLCVYHAERHVPSGLVAVGYSASPLLAGLGAWALWRTPLTARFCSAGACGVAGVALDLLARTGRHLGRPTAALGLAFTVGAVLLSAVGALAASRNSALVAGLLAGTGLGPAVWRAGLGGGAGP
jgi:drug/metabolite transporter (DMT)-like permease